VFDCKTEEGIRMLEIVNDNEMVFTALLLSIDVSISSSGNVVLDIVKMENVFFSC
jgi:hypothetical protein